MEIRTEAAHFPAKEYINEIFVAVQIIVGRPERMQQNNVPEQNVPNVDRSREKRSTRPRC